MQYLSTLSSNKMAWLLLAFSAFAFEISALFFQYGLKLEPCIMCIYQRVAILGILVAGIVGIYTHKYLLGRIFAFTFWGIGGVWGLLLSIEHYEIQSSTMSFLLSCEITPNFPSWLPLHEWLPSLFAATGDCGDIDWQFFGYSMPQVMILIFSIYTIALLCVLLSQLIIKRKL